MILLNPYFDFFSTLPCSFQRDPLLPISAPESISVDWLTLKAAIARHFAWAVPNEEAISCILKYASEIIEIGAGSGYWAWLMHQAGIDVVAFDVDPPPFTWIKIGKGNEQELLNHRMKTLFLCWPPWATDMAANALALYRGKHVIYVGEWMLGSADARFYWLLETQYEAIDSVVIPQWYARADRLIVFRRRDRNG
jgi:hypothetical protein